MQYHVLNSSIVLNYLNKTVVISNSDNRFDPVLACIRESADSPERLDDIPAIVEIERAFDGKGLKLVDGILHANESPIPAELNERILQYKDQGLPYEPLLAFWENLKLNPSFNARQMLFAFLSHNGHPLTADGCFIAYRGVTDEFKDVHTGKFDNSVGSVCKMNRTDVDDNPNNTCSHGLHVACYDYARGFGPKLIEVKVNPKDVVAVPTDYNGTKMRVCEFEVVGVGESIRTEALYGHTETASKTETEDDGYDEDTCSECGEWRSPGDNYCSDCGHEYDS
jgi:hypothetical protein